MKYVLAFFFAAVIGQGAIIYTEPIRLSGTGLILLHQSPTIQETGVTLSLGGGSSEAGLSVSYFGQDIHGIRLLGNVGSTVDVTESVGEARLGPFGSRYFYYYVNPRTRGGEIILFDSEYVTNANVIASAPIIGYFHYTLLEHSVFPSGDSRTIYLITVLPTPEPAAWQLGLLGLVPFVVFAHKRRNG